MSSDIAPGCSPIGNSDVQNLIDYYDLHREVTVTVFDPSRIDWTSTGLDSASLLLSVASLNAAPKSVEALYTSYTSQVSGGASSIRSFTSGDSTGGWLSVGGFVPPPIGTVFSGASIIRDVSAGFYEIPYSPPIPR